MTVPPTTTCASCNSIIGDDDEVCAQCGTPMTPYRLVSRTPLILPGNPALSADDTSTGTPAVRGVSISVIGLVVLGAVAVIMTRDPAPRTDEAPDSTTFAAASSEGTASVDANGDAATTAITDIRTDNLVAAVTARSTTARDSTPALPSASAARKVDTTPTRIASAVATIPGTPSATPATAPPATQLTASQPPATQPSATQPSAPRTAATLPTIAATKPAASHPTNESIVQEAPTAPGVTRSSVVSAAPATPTPVPVLRMVPLISKELRTGEMLRLRGSLQDLATGRALPDGIRYSSADPRIARVDSRTGEVTGVSAGRVRIVADGGAAGKQGVDLSIIAIPKPVIAPTVAAATPRTTPTPTAASPTVARAVVATPPSAKPVAAAPTSTPTSVTPTPAKPLVVASSTPVIRPNAAQPATLRVDSAAARSVARPPVARAPIASVASTGSTIAPQLLRDVERPDASDTRAAAERIASDIRTGGRRNGELTQFFVDGASHRVGIAGAPTIVGETANGVRVTFELRISKYDAGGRPMTRLVPVQMDVAKREEGLSTTAIAIGALRRP